MWKDKQQARGTSRGQGKKDIAVGSTRIRRSIYAIALLGATVVAGPGTAEAASGPSKDSHCVVTVVSIDEGEIVTGPEMCFSSEAMMRADARSTTAWASSTIIGTHYTSKGYSGSSITIMGSTCGGGVWHPTGFWNNNIESSRHFCGSSPTTFYNGSNCSTGPYSIYSGRTTLGSANNKASCIRYG